MTEAFSIEIGRITYTIFPPTPHSLFDRPQFNNRSKIARMFLQRLEELESSSGILYPEIRTIVPTKGDTTFRIDNQPSSAEEYNISYQAPTKGTDPTRPGDKNSSTYAVVLIDADANVFSDVIVKLFVAAGLTLSFNSKPRNSRDAFRYRIRVQRSEGPPSPDEPEERDYTKITKLLKTIEARIAKYNAKRRFQTKIVENIEKAIEKTVEKALEKESSHFIAKKIPLVSFFSGLFFASQRIADGDYRKAFLEFTSGLAGDFPGEGTAISTVIDIDLLAEDVRQAIEDQESHKRLEEHKLEEAEKALAELEAYKTKLIGESRIYGKGHIDYYDESHYMHFGDISKIYIRCGDMVDGIQVTYGNQTAPYHGMNGGEPKVFELKRGEKILRVLGRAGDNIDSLTFCTNFRQSETFGGHGGDFFEFTCKDGFHIGAIKGFNRGALFLPALGFISTIDQHTRFHPSQIFKLRSCNLAAPIYLDAQTSGNREKRIIGRNSEDAHSYWCSGTNWQVEGDINGVFKLKSSNSALPIYLDAQSSNNREKRIVGRGYEDAHTNWCKGTNWQVEGDINGVFKLRSCNSPLPIYLDAQTSDNREKNIVGRNAEDAHSDWCTGTNWQVEIVPCASFKLSSCNLAGPIYLDAQTSDHREKRIVGRDSEDAHSDWCSGTNWQIEGDINGVFKLRSCNLSMSIYLDAQSSNNREKRIVGRGYEDAHTNWCKGTNWQIEGDVNGVFKLRSCNSPLPIYLDAQTSDNREKNIVGRNAEDAHSDWCTGTNWMIEFNDF